MLIWSHNRTSKELTSTFTYSPACYPDAEYGTSFSAGCVDHEVVTFPKNCAKDKTGCGDDYIP